MWNSVRFSVYFRIEIEGCGIHWGKLLGYDNSLGGELLASHFGLRSITFGVRGIILTGFWHHFSILGGSLGSLGGSLGFQGWPKSDFSDFLLIFPLIPPRFGLHFGVIFGVLFSYFFDAFSETLLDTIF